MHDDQNAFVAFCGPTLLARGDLEAVVRAAKTRHDEGGAARIALYDEATGRPTDVDLGGDLAQVLAGLAGHPLGPGGRKGPGRPKLGVVAREVTLLPRHWAWLEAQRGGASAALRRLVDEARKATPGQESTRRAIDAAHAFMWDIAGDQAGFEEASRALFAEDFARFFEQIAGWPQDLRAQLERFLGQLPKTSSEETPPM